MDISKYCELDGFDGWQKGLEKVRFHTCFNNMSYFGYKASWLKSGICKYMRRNEKSKFKWCVSELLLYNMVDNAQALVSNLINRLKILIMEEVCVLEFSRISMCIQKLNDFENSNRKDFAKIMEFVEVVFDAKKSRSISYIYGWWRTNEEVYNMADIKLNKVVKYAKKGDDENLLKFGELLIEFIELRDEKIVDIYIKMSKIEKGGLRFRRKDGLYLFMEIIKDYYVTDNCSAVIFEFALNMIHRKSMNERLYFGVWIGVLMWKKGNDENNMNLDIKIDDIELMRYIISRENIEFDDYVVNDFHVNSKLNSISKFAEEGAYVVNENMELLGIEKHLKYKSHYINMKKLQDAEKVEKVEKAKVEAKEAMKIEKAKAKIIEAMKEKNAKAKVEAKEAMKIEKAKAKVEAKEAMKIEKAKAKIVEAMKVKKAKAKIVEAMKVKKAKAKVVEAMKVKKAKDEEVIKVEHVNVNENQKLSSSIKKKKIKKNDNFQNLESNLEYIDDKINENEIILCSDNTCGNKVMCFEYRGKIWKEGRKSMNYNRDCCVVDECKEMFGLKQIGTIRVIANFRVVKIEKKQLSWQNNWKIEYIKENEEKVVYCVMNKINSFVKVGKVKNELVENRAKLKEFAKIGIFRGIFRVSDFNVTNVLMDGEQNLVSIDECCLGNRKNILSIRWLKALLNKDISIVKEILKEINICKNQDNVNIIKEKMSYYLFNSEEINKVIENWNNLGKDLESEGVIV